MSEQHEIRILVVDDEEINRDNIAHVLAKDGYVVETAADGEEALATIKDSRFDLIITDLKMGNLDGVQMMETAKELLPDAEVIIITGYATVNSAVDAMAKGAFYYLPKPIKLNELKALVKKALEKTVLKREIRALRQEIKSKKGAVKFIGQNEAVLKLKDEIALIAQLDCNVLITGETGTGKELVARTLWEMSSRADKRFLPINCGALTEELMLNELFGHEKDAFTGASKWRKGLLESANGGVVLLDEIGEMPLMMQVKLLRVLQDKKIIRVGGTREIPIDLRILAATNRDLQQEVRSGKFRQDLYYRLNVVSIHIPPLRKRKDDIPLLVRHFLARHPSGDGTIKSITPEAMSRLTEYDYPGNVRELENIIERSLALCSEPEITVQHLPENLNPGAWQPTGDTKDSAEKPLSLEEYERNYILSILKSVHGNKTRAAKIMGIDRVSLWRKLKRYQSKGYNVEEYLRK